MNERAEAYKDVIATLNDLIEVCKDAEYGFRTAAEGLSDNTLKSQCLEYSQQRAEFARELQSEVQRLGGEPEERGSVAGTMHRGWIDIKAAVTGKNDHAVIVECERGEDVSKDAYEKALNTDTPEDTERLLERQYMHVKEVHDRFSALQRVA